MDARCSKTEARTERPRKNDGKAVRVTTCDGRTELVSAKKEQTLNSESVRERAPNAQRPTPKLRTYRKLGIEGGIAEIEGKAAR
jgi:hypothetical protein